jgi:hypothetical protein
MPQGWTCPRCNRVNAPSVLECPCSAARLVEISPPWVAPGTETVPADCPPTPSRTCDPIPTPTWTLWCGRPVQETKAVFE